jgi:chromosome segregation ATPase
MMTDAQSMDRLTRQLDRIEAQTAENSRLLVRLETRLDSYDARAMALEDRLAKAEEWIAHHKGKQAATQMLVGSAAGLGGLGGISAILSALGMM